MPNEFRRDVIAPYRVAVREVEQFKLFDATGRSSPRPVVLSGSPGAARRRGPLRVKSAAGEVPVVRVLSLERPLRPRSLPRCG